jgi:hypothetical protein
LILGAGQKQEEKTGRMNQNRTDNKGATPYYCVRPAFSKSYSCRATCPSTRRLKVAPFSTRTFLFVEESVLDELAEPLAELEI